MKQQKPSPEVLKYSDPVSTAEEWDVKDEADRARLIDAVYPQLKRIAENRMQRERPDHTLQPTALVNEFFLVLARQQKFTVTGRAHFLAIASRAMHRMLIDYARYRGAERHGGAAVNIQLDPSDLQGKADGLFDMLELDQLLERLGSQDARMAQVVELKCFGGLTFSEISEVLSIDERTAKRDWEFARAWLFGHLTQRKKAKRGKGDAD